MEIMTIIFYYYYYLRNGLAHALYPVAGTVMMILHKCRSSLACWSLCSALNLDSKHTRARASARTHARAHHTHTHTSARTHAHADCHPHPSSTHIGNRGCEAALVQRID